MRAFLFLFRHPASGLLYFRLSVPPQYRAALGKTELKRSLRTYDKRIAVTIAARLWPDNIGRAAAIAMVIAFLRSGRLIVTVATPSLTTNSTAILHSPRIMRV